MRMSNRRLQKTMQEHPVTVQPKKKEEMLALARTYDEREKNEHTEDGLQMKYMRTHKIRTLVLAAVILSLMAVAVTAGIVNYYYRTPGGKIVDQSGAVIVDTGDISLKMTGEKIKKDNYTIEEVDWVSKDGNTTFTVWMSADSPEMPGLYARYNGTDYPLTKSFITRDKDGNPLAVGYTAVNFPEPQIQSSEKPQNHLWLLSEDPFVSVRINFEPEGVETASVTVNDITFSAYIYNGHLYYNMEDHTIENNPIMEISTDYRMHTSIESVTDADGNEHELERISYSSGEGVSMDSFKKLPENVTPASVTPLSANGCYYLRQIEGVTYCDLPIPEVGETLTGEWVIFDYAGIRRTITEITRDKYSITYYSPEEDHTYSRYLPKELFSELVYSVSYHVFFELEDSVQQTGAHNTRPEGGMYRIASKEMNEFCEGRDSIRVGIRHINTSYSAPEVFADLTLTFPEN
ncbi:MAG: hypothetical protein IKU40_02705 [Clostridia bacterium]|nr:hypothetical protein [Clostridia bacterium]